MKTKITEMFDIKYPIFCGTMYSVSTVKLASAISNAGGMGNLTAANYKNSEEFRLAIKEMRTLTKNPFMVGITILPINQNMVLDDYKKCLDVCIEEKIPGLEVSGMYLNRIGKQYISLLKENNIKIFHKVGNTKQALEAEKLGYDGIIASGYEAGGHPSMNNISTAILIEKISNSIKIPVIASGGIATGKSLLSALSLGAEGILMGTRFFASEECEVHNNIKNEIVNKQEDETIIISKSSFFQLRAIKNNFSEKYIISENDVPLLKQALITGNLNICPIPAGQTIGNINSIETCENIINNIIKEYYIMMEKIK